MTHAEVDLDICQAYGICAQLAPAVFELDDDGYASVSHDGEVAEGEMPVTADAVEACPVRAITLS
ncbi:MAG: hypothetical protein ABS81_10270 [Pseudonocardia sp. SCN 72-86]|nr:MAG: hypothetical protein ABS81_10270 [Pseudonocardia sp. SCN 72-86]